MRGPGESLSDVILGWLGSSDERSPIALIGGMQLTLEIEYPSPVVLHANDEPPVLVRLVIKRLRESPDLSVGQALRRSICVFAGCVIVQNYHREAQAAA